MTMLTHSPTIVNLATAMRTVQQNVGTVPTDSTNPHFRNKYASLAAVNDAIREHYLAAGLAVMQAPGSYAEGTMTLTTLIVHAESGEWLSNEMQIPVAKTDPQGAGSALTYAERYSLMALFNLPPVDDDAEAVVQPARQPVAAATTRAPVPPAPAPAPAAPSAGTGTISQAAVSSEKRQRLMEAMAKQRTRVELRTWADIPKVAAAIESLTTKDGAMFTAEFEKAWHALPETLAMAG